MKKKLLVLPLLLISINALDLNEAVDIALKENYDIKMKNLDYKQSLDAIKINESNYFPKLDLFYNYNKKNKVNINQDKEDATFSAKISYNLFNGLKDISNKKASKFLSKASKYYLEALKQDIILETKNRYISYLNKDNLEDTYESQYKLFESQFKDAKNKYEQGLIAKNDLLQVQVNMSNSKQNLIKAKADKKLAKLRLSNILGGFDLTNENIKKLSEISLPSNSYNIKALDKRSEIQAIKMNLKSLRNEQKSIKSSYYPKLDASFSHNRYYKDLGFDKVENRVDNQNIASLNASWNLYNGSKDYNSVKINRKKMAKLKALLEKTNLDIKLQYENAKSDLDVSNENLKTAILALEQAEENYNIVRNRFKEGISTSTDLTDANYLLTQAKQRHIKAYFDKYLALATLNRVFEIRN